MNTSQSDPTDQMWCRSSNVPFVFHRRTRTSQEMSWLVRAYNKCLDLRIYWFSFIIGYDIVFNATSSPVSRRRFENELQLRNESRLWALIKRKKRPLSSFSHLDHQGVSMLQQQCLAPQDIKSAAEELDMQQNRKQLSRLYKGDITDWSLLKRPAELARAVKRYHNCIWLNLVTIIGGHSIAVFTATKLVLLSYWTPMSEDFLDHLDSIWFPNLTRFVQGGRLLIYLYAFVMINLVAVRCVFFRRLIKHSIQNRYLYRRLLITQRTLSYLSTMKFSWRELIYIVRYSFRHRDHCRSDPKLRRIHCSCQRISEDEPNQLLAYKQMDYFNLKYGRIMIDSNACIEHSGLQEFFQDSTTHGWFRNWFRAQPLHLYDLSDIGPILIVLIISATLAFWTIMVYMVLVIYVEMIIGGYQKYGEGASLGQLVRSWFTIVNIIRFIDSMIYVIAQLSIHIDSSQFYYASGSIASQARKLADMYELELDVVRMLKIKLNQLLQHGPDQSINDDGTLAALRRSLNSTARSFHSLNNISSRYETGKDELDMNYRAGITTNLLDLDPQHHCHESWKLLVIKRNDTIIGLQFERESIDMINDLLVYYSKLIHSLMDELDMFKDEWATYLNLITATNVVCLSYIILYSRLESKGFTEIFLLTFFLLNCCAPLVMAWYAAVLVELRLRHICPIISGLLVNELGLLRPSTLKTMMKVNERLREAESRSFLIGNRLALSPATIMQILAFVPTILSMLPRLIKMIRQTP